MLSLFFLPSTSDTQRCALRRLAVWLGLLLALAVYGAFGRQLFLLSTLGTVFLYIVLTQAWNILGGYGGYLNFGMVTFFGSRRLCQRRVLPVLRALALSHGAGRRDWRPRSSLSSSASRRCASAAPISRW